MNRRVVCDYTCVCVRVCVYVCGPTKHRLRGFVLKAIRVRDLSRASRRNEQQGLSLGADVDAEGSLSVCPNKGCKKHPEQWPQEMWSQGVNPGFGKVTTGLVFVVEARRP